MLQSIKRLDQGLRFWQSKCYICATAERLAQKPEVEAHWKRFPLKGPLAHASSFHQYLLQSFHTKDPFDEDKYLGNEDIQRALMPAHSVPWFLWAWNRTSRRVYQISRELQLLLSVTSLEDVTWGDIHFPFPCFGIALVDPIADEGTGNAYDFIMPSIAQNQKTGFGEYNFLLFPQSLDRYQYITSEEKLLVDKAFRKKKLETVIRHLDKFTSRGGINLAQITYTAKGSVDKTIEDVQRISAHSDYPGDSNQGITLFQKMSRIIFGLCLYLKSLPPGHVALQEEAKPKKKRSERAGSVDSSCITDMAELWTVSSNHKLSNEEREVLENCRTGASGYEVRAHFRCGYWRRPPGLGQDPTAQKTVWVRPTLVRRDRVLAGSVPGGSQIEL
jgi:hypothetical protein